jgi:Protein of unknown function (DUF3303)
MVVETYTTGAAPVYERARAQGRILPKGLIYLDSWVDANRLDRCFQLMETDDPTLFDEWTRRWRDIVDFEIVPVISSAEAASRS